jgi:hypothetical protein
VADAVQGAQLLQRFMGKNPLGASRHHLYGHARAQGDVDPAHGATGFAVRLPDQLAANYEA